MTRAAIEVTRALPDHLAPRDRGLDATSLLTVYAILLIGLPSKFIVGPLGGAGTPAQILGAVGAIWYLWYRIQRPVSAPADRQPVRTAMLLFVGAVMISYVGGMVRPISSIEISTADLGLISLASWLGVVLVANDGIVSRARLYTLLRRIVALGGALATLGVIQFITGESWIDRIAIPGLTVNQGLTGVAAREGFNRPSGTAVHPIEFGVVLTVILPIALTCAMTMRDRSWIRRWYPSIAIAIAIPLSISRTAIVGTAVGLIVLLPTWSKGARRLALAAIGGLLVIFFLTVPGFLGTITGLFTGINNDGSAQSRTGSYGIAWEFIQRSPLIGRGFSTFLPSYWILDNQYLALMIEIGLVGLIATFGLLVTAFASAMRARGVTRDPIDRQVGASLAAAVATGASSMALYDLLGFPMSAGILFLTIGLCGAHWRLVRQQPTRVGRHAAEPITEVHSPPAAG